MNTRTMSSIAGIIAALVIGGLVAGCQSGGNQQESQQQQADTNSLEASQPLPHFNYSQYRQTLIDAETAEANGTQTTTFFFQMGDADPVFSCPSYGEAVAVNSSLSNPQQVIGLGSNNGVTTGQEDPDGVYASESSLGTYVICLNSAGQKYLDYWEGDVFTVAGAASWDTASHSIKVTGAPTAAVHTAPSTSAGKSGR